MPRTSTVNWTGIGPKIVRLGQTWVFSRARLVSIGADGAPDLFAEFEVRNGVPECTTIRWDSKAGGRGVRTADLHAMQVDGLVHNAFIAHAKAPALEDAERSQWAASGDIERAMSQRSRGPSEEELREVAEIYKAHVPGNPTAAVEARLGLSRRTAARRVQQARAAGLLPPTTAGKRRA